MKKWIFFIVSQVIFFLGVGFYFFSNNSSNTGIGIDPVAGTPSISETQALPVNIKTNYTITANINPSPAFSSVYQNGKGVLTIRIVLKEANRKVLVNDTTAFAQISIPNPQFPYKAVLNLSQLIQSNPNPILQKLVPLPGDTLMISTAYCQQGENTPGLGLNCPNYGKNQNDSLLAWHFLSLNDQENITANFSIDTRFQLRKLKEGPIALSGTITLNKNLLSRNFEMPALVLRKTSSYLFNHHKKNGYIDGAYAFEPARLLVVKPIKFQGDKASFEVRRDELFDPNYDGIISTLLNDCTDYNGDYLSCATRATSTPSSSITLPVAPEEILLPRGQFAAQLYDTGIQLSN